MRASLLSLVLAFSFNTFAGLTEDYDKLKDLGRNLEPTGAICEEIAQLRFAEIYPEPKYKVVTGVEYADKEKTLGELDVVVFNNETQIVDVVGEVKCYTTMKNGLKKAKEQRKRFLTNVGSPKALTFTWLSDRSLKLAKTQFKKVQKFVSIAQLGAVAKGYDYELPYTLNELMQLREDILKCQGDGVCAAKK